MGRSCAEMVRVAVQVHCMGLFNVHKQLGDGRCEHAATLYSDSAASVPAFKTLGAGDGAINTFCWQASQVCLHEAMVIGLENARKW